MNHLDLCAISKHIIGEKSTFEYWEEGIWYLLQSTFAKQIFKHMRPEDKEMFISEYLIEPILEIMKKEQETKGDNKNSTEFLKSVIKELKIEPYGCYCAMRYPNLF